MEEREAQLERECAELKDAVARRDEFIAVIGHEIRNPLTPIVLQTELLLSILGREPERVTPEWLAPKLEKLAERAKYLVHVSNRLLDVSHVASGKLVLIPEDLDLVAAVREVVAQLEPGIQAAKVRLTIDAPAPVRGRWDRLRVEQIVMNLLSNALRYAPSGPVEIGVHSEGDIARVRVKDAGPGIAPEHQARIFERFERGGAAVRSIGGLGVGLWLVRELCVAMGGSVSVESTPGNGATFVVTVPRYGAPNP